MTSPSERVQRVDEFLKKKLVCKLGRESTNNDGNSYVDIPNYDQPHEAMKQVRDGIRSYLAGKKDSLIIIGPDPEPQTPLIEDLVECAKLLYMVVAAGLQSEVFQMLSQINAVALFNITNGMITLEKILDRLRNPDFMKVLPNRWNQYESGPLPLEIFMALATLDKGPGYLDRNCKQKIPRIAVDIAEQINHTIAVQHGNWTEIDGKPHFSLSMTPLLPDHPRWAPHRLIALNGINLVNQHSGAATGIEITEYSNRMTRNAGYPPFGFGGFYPYNQEIVGDQYHSAAEMRTGAYEEKWKEYEQAQARAYKKIRGERKILFGE